MSANIKVLFGIQGVGNGHISQAQALIPELEKQGAQVDCLVSGRERSALPKSEIFNEPEIRQGLNYTVKDGSISRLSTAFRLAHTFPVLLNDARKLDLKGTDLVVTCYEPVTALAARLRGVPSVGIGHQFSFQKGVPQSTFSLRAASMMAPAHTQLGLHWHHFDRDNILPPIVGDIGEPQPPQKGKILVYLPVETLEDITAFLLPHKEQQFYVYGPQIKEAYQQGNLLLHPVSRAGFRKDFADCEGVITNAGFETPSEALQLGKKILVKPLGGQPEQMANGYALQTLGLARMMDTLDPAVLEDWLSDRRTIRITYPDVAGRVADWLVNDPGRDVAGLCNDLWCETNFHDHKMG